MPRWKRGIRFAALIVVLRCAPALASESALSVRELSCEYRAYALGIDTRRPRFSWVLDSSARGEEQSAYHILVASGEETLRSHAGDKWDSGKVLSTDSVHIPYEGRTLSSRERCYWKVRVWDRAGRPSAWSDAAAFEMGLLAPEDWRAQWIGAGPGETYTGGAPKAADPASGSALDLRGSRGSIRIRHHLSLKPSPAMTITAWMRLARYTPQWQCVIRKGDGARGRWLLAIGDADSTGGIHAGFVVDGTYYERCGAVEPALLADGEWHLAAAAYDGSHIRIYFDGAQVGSWPVAGSLSTAGTADVYVGSYRGESEFLDGAIDDLRVYGRALAAEEIAGMFRSGEASDARLAAWWRFDGDLRDSSPNANHGRYRGGSGPSSPLLRKEFLLPRPVASARAYVCGLGWNELYLNGRRIGDAVLDPETTDYDKRMFYVVHDVTSRLRAGRNAVAVMLGNGWFCPAYGAAPVLLLQLEVRLTDGTRVLVQSDGSWKTAGGPILENSIPAGEVYDARREQPGWTEPGFDDAGWSRAERRTSPGGVLMPQMLPPIEVNESLSAVAMSHPAPGVYVYDLGTLFAGWVRVHLRGPAGTRVTLKYAPLLRPDGLLKELPQGRSRDVYVLRGDAEGEDYEPRFTFHPVRYVQVENCPEPLERDDVIGRMAYNAVDMSGGFECANSLLNRIHAIVRQTIKNELYGIQMDCINAEHWGWLEPGSTPGTLYPRIYMPLFWTKYLDDARFAQHADGVIPDVIPCYPIKNRTTGDPAWAGNYPMAVWYLYQYYEDRRLLEEHYPSMRRWVENLRARAEGHILRYGYYGDHMLPGPAPGEESWMSEETPFPLIRTAFYYNNAKITSQIAGLLGYADDASRYGELADAIRRAFHETWFDAATNRYASGSQTSQLLPLAMGIVPAERENRVVENVVDDIVEVHEGHHHTGNIGTTALVQALTKGGHGDVLYRLVNRVDYPGWGYMLAQGATTVWESWGGRSTNDDRLSMAMFTTIDRFFYNDLAGIRGPEYFSTASMTPGFKAVRIEPFVPEGLEHARAWHRTVRGIVSSGWHRGEGRFLLRARIPVNSAARIRIPKLGLRNVRVAEGERTVWEDGAFLPGVAGVAGGGETAAHVEFQVGSGLYEFRLTGEP
ncbi:MAG: family 78 glycoside hydrolase catalytic domain [Planctomycetes bacterium]|nr:family 78 glycoside hydrolase catalytic domain [Planctomycetota bacterium]